MYMAVGSKQTKKQMASDHSSTASAACHTASAAGQTASAASAACHSYMAVIGTAGRKEDACKMNAALFSQMMLRTVDIQHNVFRLPNDRVILVSGGAAWADHVAVKLFLQEAMNPDGNPYAGLHIYFPCKLERIPLSSSGGSSTRAFDNGSWKWQDNPGRTMNHLHDLFGGSLGCRTMNDFSLALAFGAQLHDTSDGFHARNKLVAQRANYMVAFTWSESAVPKEGGTLHTWNLCKTIYRIHVPLKQFVPSQPAAAATPLSNWLNKRKPDDDTSSQSSSRDRDDAFVKRQK